MARQASYALVAALLIAGCAVAVHSASVNVSSKAFAGTRSISGADGADGSGADGTAKAEVASAAFKLLTSKLNATMEGLQAALGGVLRASGITPAVYDALTGPLLASTTHVLNSMSVVRDAYDTTLKGFLGLLLDNTRELRRTLEDGNAIIDTVRTLRGAKCEEAAFEPPTQKPARVMGPAGSFKVTTGQCTLRRVATPLKLDFVLDCVEPGVAVDIKVPRYTSRFVSAATAVSEECKVTRKYGVESETTVTLFNAADFLNAAQGASAGAPNATGPAAAGADGGLLGLNRGAGWASTLFPVLGKHKVVGGRVQFMPQGVAEAVKQAIKEASLNMTLSYKPFTLKADIMQSADNVAQALAQQFEVKQRLFKVYRDDLAGWVNADTRAETLKDLDFGANLRASMAKMNMTSLFDGVFAQTASKLMAKTKLGGVLGGKLAGGLGGLAGSLSSEKPLRTLLSKVRTGPSQPVDVILQTTLDGAVDALRAGPGLSQLLSALPKKGSLLELLVKDKGSFGKLQELSKVLDSLASLDGSQLQPEAAPKQVAKPEGADSAAEGGGDGGGAAAAGIKLAGGGGNDGADADADGNTGGDGDADGDAADATSGGVAEGSKP